MDTYGYVHVTCGHLSFSRHFPNAFLIEMYNCHLRKGHASAAEAIFGFNWVNFMCPQRDEEEEGVRMFEGRDDIHILPMFWFQTVRESKEADEVC